MSKISRPCPECNHVDWDTITIKGRTRAVCVHCLSAWWIEEGSLVGVTQPLFE